MIVKNLKNFLSLTRLCRLLISCAEENNSGTIGKPRLDNKGTLDKVGFQYEGSIRISNQ